MFASSKTASVSGGYQISRSLRFNSADSPSLGRTPTTTSNQRTSTLSLWVKRGTLGAEGRIMANDSSGSATIFWVLFNSSDQIQIYTNGTGAGLVTTQVFRDPSAWYHIVVAVDTTQATGTNRIKLYVNGLQVTAFTGTQTYYSLNEDIKFNSSSFTSYLGFFNTAAFNGYMTEVNWIDGQQLTPSSFGETNAQTGVWQPKAYSGSYGTNGFYLNFSDNSNTTAATLGKDYSGNGNNWTPNGFLVSAGAGNDSLVDSPTSYGTDTGVGGTVRGNYCTFNPLFRLGGTTALTWALNGNLQAKSDSNASMIVYGTMGLDPSTKFYSEFTMVNTVEAGDHVGIVTDIQAVADSGTCVAYRADGQKIVNGTVSSYGASYTDNDIIGIAVNLVDNQVTFYKNGTSQGTITGVTSGTYFHRVRFNNVVGQQTEVYGNWGQRAFANTAPSGFKALCTQNLPTPTIGATTATQAGKFFNPVLYTGTGATNSITGVGFQPDWVWIKARSAAYSHRLADSVRGAGKELFSNETVAETTNSANGYVSSFNSDGFSLTSGVGVNGSATTFVAWNWKANGAGSTNTAGSITSTVSANTTSGFSVVTYTGSGVAGTIGHGLGVAPSMIIVKSRSADAEWPVYNKTTGNGNYLVLNTTALSAASSTMWNATSPTSSVFSVGINTTSNTVTATYVAYCFAPIEGYSAFGSYTGNGSADGPFVYCGFRPAFVMAHAYSGSANQWLMTDDARNPDNVVNRNLNANEPPAEVSAYNWFDYTATGFKVKDTINVVNANGSLYIFMAFAETPFKYSLAR
jgi:hypothetical protein